MHSTFDDTRDGASLIHSALSAPRYPWEEAKPRAYPHPAVMPPTIMVINQGGYELHNACFERPDHVLCLTLLSRFLGMNASSSTGWPESWERAFLSRGWNMRAWGAANPRVPGWFGYLMLSVLNTTRETIGFERIAVRMLDMTHEGRRAVLTGLSLLPREPSKGFGTSATGVLCLKDLFDVVDAVEAGLVDER